VAEPASSHRDRVLADKQSRRAAQEALEQEKLRQARVDAFKERERVALQPKPHLQSALAPLSSPTHPSSSPPLPPRVQRVDSEYADDFERDDLSGGGYRDRDGHEHDEDEDEEEIEDVSAEVSESEEDVEEKAKELEVEAEAIEEVEGLLLNVTRKIQDLRTSIEVPSVFEEAAGGEEAAYDEEIEEVEEEAETEDQTLEAAAAAAPQQPYQLASSVATAHAHGAHSGAPGRGSVSGPASSPSSVSSASPAPAALTGDVKDRMKSLAKECAKLVGRAKFIEAFTFLQEHEALAPGDKLKHMNKILGPEKVQHWEKIDQIVFMDRSA